MPTIPSEFIGVYVMSLGCPPSRESYSTMGGAIDVTSNPFNDATIERLVDTIASTCTFSDMITSTFTELK